MASLTGKVSALESRRSELQDSVNAKIAEQNAKLEAQQLKHRQTLDSDEQKATRKLEKKVSELTAQIDWTEKRRLELKQALVADEDSAMLQEVGVYQSRHPLTDAAGFQAQLAMLRDRTKTMNRKDGGAVLGTTAWTVNGSASKGRVMVNETSKLMLRAYNAEADNLVRAMKPFKLDASIDRLNRVATTIERLGKTMSISISAPYHRLRITELEITADYLTDVPHFA
jgi:hypothetical protein